MQALIAILAAASGISFVYGLTFPADSAERIKYATAACAGLFVLAVVVANSA